MGNTRAILRRFASDAFRRPVSDDKLDILHGLVNNETSQELALRLSRSVFGPFSAPRLSLFAGARRHAR